MQSNSLNSTIEDDKTLMILINHINPLLTPIKIDKQIWASLNLHEQAFRIRNHLKEDRKVTEIKELMITAEPYVKKIKFSVFPKELLIFSNLQNLCVSLHEFTEIPEDIRLLKKLNTLNLSFNKINNLPKEMNELTSLTKLDLSNNKLSGLPEEFKELTSLTELRLGKNDIKVFPPAIAKLTNLKILSMSYNSLKTFPLEIENLLQLQEVHLDFNDFTEIPQKGKEIAKKIKFISCLSNEKDLLEKSYLL